MLRMAHGPLRIAEVQCPSLDITQKEREFSFHMKVYENFVHLLFYSCVQCLGRRFSRRYC